MYRKGFPIMMRLLFMFVLMGLIPGCMENPLLPDHIINFVNKTHDAPSCRGCRPPVEGEGESVEGEGESVEDEGEASEGEGEAILRAMYEAAIMDAQFPEADDISDQLIAIVPDNEYLYFRESTDGIEVLMVTWTAWTGYDDYVGKAITMDPDYLKADMDLTRDVWVTAAPEVREFACTLSGQSHEAVVLRLEQRLGLPPNDGKTRFVEMWVNTEDLFRPSPDNEITDSVAALDFPPDASPDYIEWFEHLVSISYSLENGYPWTRLGYTYDWKDPDHKIGFSEFVIRTGAIVSIHAVILTEAYCETSGSTSLRRNIRGGTPVLDALANAAPRR